MRRAIAISLMMLFSWTLMAPLFAQDSDASLPACCRKNGKHHCNMGMMASHSDGQRGFTTVAEKCPCRPSSASATHSPRVKAEMERFYYAEVVSHPARCPQTEALYRVSLLRSHQKRGPPAPQA